MTGYENTSFTLDMLGRNVCNTFEEAVGNDPEGIDVVVLGGGMYGGYVASEVYNRSAYACYSGDVCYPNRRPLRVVVLEAGPLVALEHAQNLPDVGLGIPGETYVGSGATPEVQNGVWGFGWRSNKKYTGTAYCVGGKGLYWGGWAPRQSVERDIPQWPKEFQDYLLEKEFPNPQPYSTKQTLKGAYEYLEYQTGVEPHEDFIFDESAVLSADVKSGLNKVLLSFMNQRVDKIVETKTQIAPIAVSTRSDASGMLANNKFSSLPILISAIRRDRTVNYGEGQPNRLSIVPYCHVSKLICRKDANGHDTRTIQTIEVMYKGQPKKLTIAPTCQVVLAMYAIESTRLALESFSLVSNGLKPPVQELMGNNLHTHLRFDFTFRFSKSFLDQYSMETTKSNLAKLLQVTTLHVAGDTKVDEFQYQYQLFAASNSQGTADDILYKLVPSIDLVRVLGNQQDSNWITIILRASGEMPTNRSSHRAADFVDLTKDPKDDDKLNNHKRAWVQWGDHDNDPIWHTMYEQAKQISQQFGPSVEYQVSWNSWSKSPPQLKDIQQGLGTTYHDAGTLWMGDDPNTSVADTNGHFHHVSNAYIADQAAFSTNAVANPVPIGLAVARKVSEDIFSKHLSYELSMGTHPPETGFQPLITSRDQFYQDWSAVGPGIIDFVHGQSFFGDPATWILETTPQSGGIGFIYFNRKKFADYVLKLQYKAFRTPAGGEEANSGVFGLMSTPPSNYNVPITYYDTLLEVQIDESGKHWRGTSLPPIYGSSYYKTGSVYGVAPATQWAAKVAAPENTDGFWNEYRIVLRSKGKKISVFLNDKEVVSNVTIPDNRNPTGFVGLQVHTGKVQFKNIRIKEL